jgi:pimeloyl-ACP methyl ester carboxylesterase
MYSVINVSVLLVFLTGSVAAAQTPVGPCPGVPAYGDNAAASGRAKVNGISLYYESYGQGAPLLVIHGNGGSIDRLRCQIGFFSKTRRVIAADSRSHGHSENGPAPLKYEQIADDLSELVRSLGIERIDVLGHSDGGIVALLLAIRHPSQVGKVVASSPNLTPEVLALATGPRSQLQLANEMIEAGDHSQDWTRLKMQKEMVLNEPHISINDLRKITAPTLIMAGDNDVIPLNHIIEIANGIPHAQLAVLPAATHDLLRGQYDLYNFLASRFFEVTFSRR